MTPARVGGGLLISLYPTEHPTARPSFVRQMMLSKTLLLALLGTSTVTALKKQPRSALRLRGGGVDATQIATGLAYVSSGFILLPAGRDIVSHSTNLLPGEDTTRPLMMAAHPSARAFTWGLWGVNHCFIAVLKLLAIKNDDKAMLKLLTASALATTFLLHQGAAGHDRRRWRCGRLHCSLRRAGRDAWLPRVRLEETNARSRVGACKAADVPGGPANAG